MAQFINTTRKKFAIGSAAVLAFIFTPALVLATVNSSKGNSGASRSSLLSPTPPPISPVKAENTDSTSLEVNGEPIDVPDNGTVNKVVESDDGSKAQVFVNKQSSSSTDEHGSSNDSSLEVNIESTSEN